MHRQQLLCHTWSSKRLLLEQVRDLLQEGPDAGLPFPSSFQALTAQGLPAQAPITAQQLAPVPQSQPAVQSQTASQKYESPLTAFRSYR